MTWIHSLYSFILPCKNAPSPSKKVFYPPKVAPDMRRVLKREGVPGRENQINPLPPTCLNVCSIYPCTVHTYSSPSTPRSRRTTGSQLVQSPTTTQVHLARLSQLVRVLKEPTMRLVDQPLPFLQLGITLGPQTTEIADLRFLIQLRQLTVRPVDDVVRIEEVVEFEPRCGSV